MNLELENGSIIGIEIEGASKLNNAGVHAEAENTLNNCKERIINDLYQISAAIVACGLLVINSYHTLAIFIMTTVAILKYIRISSNLDEKYLIEFDLLKMELLKNREDSMNNVIADIKIEKYSVVFTAKNGARYSIPIAGRQCVTGSDTVEKTIVLDEYKAKIRYHNIDNCAVILKDMKEVNCKFDVSGLDRKLIAEKKQSDAFKKEIDREWIEATIAQVIVLFVGLGIYFTKGPLETLKIIGCIEVIPTALALKAMLDNRNKTEKEGYLNLKDDYLKFDTDILNKKKLYLSKESIEKINSRLRKGEDAKLDAAGIIVYRKKPYGFGHKSIVVHVEIINEQRRRMDSIYLEFNVETCKLKDAN